MRNHGTQHLARRDFLRRYTHFVGGLVESSMMRDRWVGLMVEKWVDAITRHCVVGGGLIPPICPCWVHPISAGRAGISLLMLYAWR